MIKSWIWWIVNIFYFLFLLASILIICTFRDGSYTSSFWLLFVVGLFLYQLYRAVGVVYQARAKLALYAVLAIIFLIQIDNYQITLIF